MIENLSFRKNLDLSRELKKANLYPFFRPIQSSTGSSVTVNNQKQVMIGSNNYLGLTHHPYVIEETIKAVEKYGTGCTGSRFLNGNLEIHEELEVEFAKYIGKEKAIVFSTGMQVNIGALSAICGPRDCILSDMENHASIIDGIRLSYGSSFKFKHNDMEELEKLLVQTKDKFKNVFIVADGVFSMTGKLFNVPKAVELAKKYGAYLYIDDAHGLGVMGPQGQGTCHFFNKENEVDLIMGTFSKSFATIGGCIAGSNDTIDYIKHVARSFMFSAAMPPSAVATARACLKVIQSEPQIFDQLWNNVQFMREGLESLGFETFNSETPIIPILIGDDILAMKITKFLEQNGVFATPVISPAVPAGHALIRTSYMASHKKEDLEYCLDIFKRVSKSFSLPLRNKEEPLIH